LVSQRKVRKKKDATFVGRGRGGENQCKKPKTFKRVVIQKDTK